MWDTFSFLTMIFYLIKCHIQSEKNIKLPTLNQIDDFTGSIDIKVKYPQNGNIYMGLGKNFYFDTEFNDTETNYFDASDIEEKTSFETYSHIVTSPKISFMNLMKLHVDYGNQK